MAISQINPEKLTAKGKGAVQATASSLDVEG